MSRGTARKPGSQERNMNNGGDSMIRRRRWVFGGRIRSSPGKAGRTRGLSRICAVKAPGLGDVQIRKPDEAK